MKQFDFSDNSKDNFIPIEPIAPKMLFVPTEESASWVLEDYDKSVSNKTGISQTPSSDMTGLKDPFFHGSKNPTRYVGISSIDTPYIINPDFADFVIYNDELEEGEDLFQTESDKIKKFGDDIQMLIIPKDRFKNEDTGLYNHNPYYLKMKPKCITTSIKAVVKGKHDSYLSLREIYDTKDSSQRRTYYEVEQNDFKSTPWNFDNFETSFQKGRLLGSVVEVYDLNGNLTVTKFVVNDDLFGTSGEAKIELSPNYIGSDSPQQQILVGSTIKIYPFETYFHPIQIILNFQSLSNTIEGLAQYLKNDVVRDTKTNIYEIYDGDGVEITGDGDIDGKVVQSYQISQAGGKEVRKNLTID